MPYRNTYSVPVWLAALSLSTACAPLVGQHPKSDPRLDQLVSKVDQSLANQAKTGALLREYGRQLEVQRRDIERLGQSMDHALKPAAANCPSVAACPTVEKIAEKTVVGSLESIWMSDLEFALDARIDTGTATSRLNAGNIELFERDGKPWVRFDVVNPAIGQPVRAERRVRRTVGMVQTASGKTLRRPVVSMNVVIGPLTQAVEFILTEWTQNDYQVQIGRNVLTDVMVVDVGRKYIAPYALPRNIAGAAR